MLKIVRTLASGSLILVMIASIGACGAESDDEGTSPADGADIEITPFIGSGVQIESGGIVIHVDPRGDYTDAKPADLILITDTPVDHLDPDLIEQLRKPGAPVVLPSTPDDARDEGSRERLLRVPDGTVMNNGDILTLAGVSVESVPM